jgi:hypothetical protein
MNMEASRQRAQLVFGTPVGRQRDGRDRASLFSGASRAFLGPYNRLPEEGPERLWPNLRHPHFHEAAFEHLHKQQVSADDRNQENEKNGRQRGES